MTQMNDVDVEKGTVNVAEFSQTEAALSILREKYSEVPSLDSKENYELVKAACSELTGYRTSLEAARKRIKEPYLDAGRIIDAEAKRITAELVKLEDPMKKAKKEYDDRERKATEARLKRLDEKVEYIRSSVERARGKDSDTIAQIIQEVDETDTTKDFYERTMEAGKARAEALERLTEIFTERVEYEKAQEELQEAREKEAAEKLKREVEDRLTKLRGIPMELFGQPAARIRQKLKSLETYQVPKDQFGERWEEAVQAKAKVQDQLAQMLEQAEIVEKAEQDKAAEAKKSELEKADEARKPELEKAAEAKKAEVAEKPVSRSSAPDLRVDHASGPDFTATADYSPETGEVTNVTQVTVTEEKDIFEELAEWSDKYEISLEASQELGEIIERHIK